MELHLLQKDYPNESESNSLALNSICTNSSQGQNNIVNIKPSAFNISPHDLTEIVNKYKERDENMQDIKYFSEQGGIDKLLNELGTNKTTGISSEYGREEHFGSNKVFQKPVPKFWDFVIESLADKMIIILICCSIFEIGISLFYIYGQDESDNKDYIDGTSIIIAVLVVVLVGSTTNYRKEKKFHQLNDIQNGTTKYNVVRNGIPKKVISDDILVGDLIKINYGEILPADMLMVEGNGIKIDESSLTGESNAVSKKPFEKCLEEYEAGNKNPSSMILLSGTNVIEGAGAAIAIAIGSHSQKGIIRGTIDNAQEDNKTPLEIKLDKVADSIGYFGIGSAVVTLVALIIRMIVEYCKDGGFEWFGMIKNILSIIILCVSIIVVAIPEGLPLAVTLSLAFSIKKLMDNNNLVRKMHACETMGGANVICTDKTGTLTLNMMFVTKVITALEVLEITTVDQNKDISLESAKKINTEKRPREEHNNLFPNDNYWDILSSAISLNVDCTITKLSQPNINGDMENFDTKNKTDKGFIEFLYQFKTPVSVKKELYLSNPENYKISPFDSKKKRMSTYIKNDQFPTGYRLFTKGGAENAMIYCNRYLNPNTGEIKDINEDIKTFVNGQINEMNKKMIRTLYLCYKDITKEDYDKCEEFDDNGLLIDQKDLIFIGIFGLKDSLRLGVKESVQQCHSAGVRVIMVTGDNLITATAIASECEIFPQKIDLNQPRERDLELNPNETNDPDKRKDHIDYLLRTQPYAMTGNSFYHSIGGIFCSNCSKDTGLCKCPKSEAEAEELAKKGQPKKPVKKDAIRNMDNFVKISTNLLVMARSQPLHKYALVLGLKELGNVVAVTGDGTNDAPALSKSDVGFSMNDGTDIAKEASDIILMDNNFSSIVIAMIYGRSIYENLRKFLQFQLTVNFCACILVFLCSCIGNETPLNSIQMLWVNLIMDSLGSLALATEPPYNELLLRKPTNRTESIINGRMWKHIILQSLCELIILLTLYLKAPCFVPESGKEMKDSAEIILNCFDELPGGSKYYDGKIIYGNKNKWGGDVKFNYQKFNNDSSLVEKFHCDYLLPNPDDWDSTTLLDAHEHYMNHYGGTTHMTLIFDIFVIYTLFNQINCRIIDDSFNTFKRISKAKLFIIVTSFEFVMQILLSQFGYKVFHCVHWGLGIVQWLICFGFSLSTMIFNFLFKLLPLERFIDPLTKGKEQQMAAEATTTIRNMVNQNLKD